MIQCGLCDHYLGFVVENDGELFSRWREAIDAGQLNVPFHVTRGGSAPTAMAT